MSWIGRLFGTAKATETVIDNVSAGLDKLIYTDEEKADDIAEARREGRAVFMEWLRSTTGSRIARRVLAVGAFAIWALQELAAVAFRIAAVFTNDAGALTSEKFRQVAAELHAGAVDAAPLVGAVFLFYFGGPAAIDAGRALVMKWSGYKTDPPGKRE